MSKLLFTRFTKIAANREEAINKLDNLSRYYAENVAIRYYKDGEIQVILALYNSEAKGDYKINFDSGADPVSGDTIVNPGVRVVRATRIIGETNLQCVNRVYGDTVPLKGDMAIIHNSISDTDTLMVYVDEGWTEIESANGQTVLSVTDTETIDLTVTKVDTSNFNIKADVPIDRETIGLNSGGKISVIEIDGGTL